ncbi:hypothetical protein HPULCUR_007579 [Helicostylum pulchrum]|uniref:OB domain-containing protein n=1 Tax=Helicostylum pulchrum TaxID=562976 RepID=A0ABP9Y6A1_9FUNG
MEDNELRYKKKGSIRSITILQAKKARIIDDTTHIIDQEETNYVALIGEVLSITKDALHTTYLIDDGTGLITVRKFFTACSEDNIKPEIYVQVYGHLRSFNRQNIFVVAEDVSVIQDYNQITYHILDCIHTHLYKIREGRE